eukprot:TRINITY_DN10715_c0_g2_i1.p1 TRINITY_DN10715_c0_g2~~TRINITY_DN10715_c0_g2_i1.p1  ORF type:complete len:171 (+),score=18.48 TRINITY_DN10715_c0_g2_i1:28-540(+)
MCPFDWAYRRHIRTLSSWDPLFVFGDGFRSRGTTSALSSQTASTDDFACEYNGCVAVLNSVAELEAHIYLCHHHECAECWRVFISKQLLDLHQDEHHNPFFRILSQRQPKYRCLVMGCNHLSWDAAARQTHLIQDHGYPASFHLDLSPEAECEWDGPKEEDSSTRLVLAP